MFGSFTEPFNFRIFQFLKFKDFSKLAMKVKASARTLCSWWSLQTERRVVLYLSVPVQYVAIESVDVGKSLRTSTLSHTDDAVLVRMQDSTLYRTRQSWRLHCKRFGLFTYYQSNKLILHRQAGCEGHIFWQISIIMLVWLDIQSPNPARWHRWENHVCRWSVMSPSQGAGPSIPKISETPRY